MADFKDEKESREVEAWNPFEYMGGDNEVRIAEDGKKKPGEIAVTVTADVGEALTGFKALQRELRETTKAARELEQAYEDLSEELAKREGDHCSVCGGNGFVSIGEGIRGVKNCDKCRGGLR